MECVGNVYEKCLSGWPIGGAPGGFLPGIPLLNWSGMCFFASFLLPLSFCGVFC